MKETNFIDQNKKKWKELEELLQEDRKDPDKLSNLFIQVSDAPTSAGNNPFTKSSTTTSFGSSPSQAKNSALITAKGS